MTHSKSIRFEVRALACAALLGAGTATAADHYQALEILGLGGGDVMGNGVGAQGQVVGDSTSAADSLTHAFATGPDGVGAVDLCPADATYCSATAINAAGRVIGAYAGHSGGIAIGFAANADGSFFRRVVGIEDTRVHFVQLTGINDRGQICGWSTGPGGTTLGWVTGAQGRPVVNFGDYTGEDVTSFALAIDDGGGVVAFVQRAPGVQYLSDHGRMRQTLAGLDNSEVHIAPDGAIAGSGPAGGSDHAVYLAPPFTQAVDLGTLGGDRSAALGAATGGRVVGYANDATGTARAFAYDPEHGLRDLNTLTELPDGVVANYAKGINERGQIVVIGAGRTWLLTPDD